MNTLYIKVSPKDDSTSVSKQIGNLFIEELTKNKSINLKVRDLYFDYIPFMHTKYLANNGSLKSSTDLAPEDIKAVDQIKTLAIEVKEADLVVIAFPLWNMSMPGILKCYLDDIVIDGITVMVSNKKIKGLLKDKERSLVIIESTGGPVIPGLNRIMNQGYSYTKDIFKFIGFKNIHKLLATNTMGNPVDENKAVLEAKESIPSIIEKIK